MTYSDPHQSYDDPSRNYHYSGPLPSEQSTRLPKIALIMSIIALVVAFIPFFGVLAFPVAVFGLIQGIGAVRREAGRKMAITAIVLSSLALLVGLVMFLALPALVFAGVAYNGS